MDLLLLVLLGAATFGLCFLFDKGFTKLFRSKAQHKSGLSVRLSRRYAVFGLALVLLGILAVLAGVSQTPMLAIGGGVVLMMGAALLVYYLSFGVFYDDDTFLVTSFGRKEAVYRYDDIQTQKNYVVQGGGALVELHMADGSAVSLQSSMEGLLPFLDHAFSAWCRQTGRDPEKCEFHDPSQNLWFPGEDA